MGGFIERIKSWWESSSSTKRYTTIGGTALTIMLLVGVFSVTSKPRFAMLYGGLSQADQAAIVTEIQTLGIPVNYDTPGQVEVPADKIAEIRMKLSTSGKVPKSAHLGINNLGDMNLYTTPAVEKERLKAIAEGELAQSIETNPGVRSARVHITLGDPSPFGDQQRPPTASISLITVGNGSINRDAARGIAMLVANSVDGMDMKNVVVLDEKSQALFNGHEIDGADSAANNKLELENDLARKEEQRLQARLDRIYGIGATEVSIRCEVNLDEVREKKNQRSIGKGQDIQTMVETMGDGKPDGGAAGMTNNLQPASTNSDGKGGYKSEVTKSEPSITETETQTNKSMGSLKSMVINVAANTGKFTEEQADKKTAFVGSVKKFVESELSNHANEPGFTASVTEIAFDDSSKKQIVTAQEDASKAARLQQIMSMLPIAALIVVGIMVVKQIGKLGRTASMVTPDGQVLHMAMENSHAPVPYSGDGYHEGQGQGRDLSLMDHDGHRISLSDDQLAHMSPEDRMKVQGGILYLDNDDVMEVEKIREKKSVHLAAIRQMAKDRPEPTAMLIKTWLSEERGGK